MTPSQKEARRKALLEIINAQQAIMDRYDHQSSINPDRNRAVITSEQYEAAKAKRDAAQAEWDALAN